MNKKIHLIIGFPSPHLPPSPLDIRTSLAFLVLVISRKPRCCKLDITILIKEAKTSFREIEVWTSFLLCSSFVCVVGFFVVVVLNVLKLVRFINAVHILISAAIACAFFVLVNLNSVRHTLCLYGPPFVSPPKTPYKVAQAQVLKASVYCIVFFQNSTCLQPYMLHFCRLCVSLSKFLAWFPVTQN